MLELLMADFLRSKTHYETVLFRDGADINENTWLNLVDHTNPSQAARHGIYNHVGTRRFAGVDIHVKKDVPEGRVWPCSCKDFFKCK